MSDYVVRRIAMLAAAAAAIDARGDAREAPLSAEVAAERAALNSADAFDSSDLSVELALLAWLRSLASGVAAGATAALAAVQQDAASRGLRQAVVLTATGAGAVMQLRQQQALSLADIPSLLSAAQDPKGFDELIWAALRDRMTTPEASRPYLYRDVAVLLPLRLETVFEPDAAGWTMLLRIVPDEASIRRDEPLPTKLEIDSLRAMWQATLDDLTPALRTTPLHEWLDTPRGRLEWQTLCVRFGPERAAWLAPAHMPTLVGNVVGIDPTPLRDRSSPNRVGGFSSRIEIWIAFGAAAAVVIDTTDVDASALEFDVVGARSASDGSQVHEKDRWWISWQAAQKVGLGRSIALPNGQGPQDIRVLYAVGLGDTNPEAHFRAQIDAGELALLPLGAPTNAVDGRQAASLGHDDLEWLRVAQRRIRRIGDPVPDNPMLSQSLAGFAAKLPACPDAIGLPNIDRVLVGALWPALWGHQMRDLWGCVDEADRLAQWASRYLRPEGPLPPIRIAEQAYGLLPTSALSRWQVSTEEGELAAQERRLVKSMLVLRDHWRDAAHSRGTAVGADTAGLLDLIGRDALSASYAYRYFVPASLWQALYAGTTGIDSRKFDAWVQATFKPLHSLLGRGADDPPGMREYLAVGRHRELRLPLVMPTQLPISFYELDQQGHPRLDKQGAPVLATSPERALAKLIKTVLESGHDISALQEKWRKLLPDSLLIRLAIESNMLSAAAAVQADVGGVAPLLEPLVGDAAKPTLIGELAPQYDPSAAHVDPAGATRRMVLSNFERLIKLVGDQPPEVQALGQIERALRATLDTAAHRIDPWITGMAARRLEYLRGLPQTRFRLGVYGWLDGPMLGKPGPTDGGLLHAPSHAQALTAVILRDKFISEAMESPAPPGGRNLWSMQLESQRIRLAEEIAEEVRLGSHFFEVLGRQVERIGADGTAPITAVDTLRRSFPMHATHADRGAVCHGPNALAGLLDSAVPPLALSAAQRERLQLLRQTIDTYGDLLVAEAVHQVVTGHADIAGAAMDAAAGLAAPPTLGFTQTPLAGDSLSTAVLCAIPFQKASADPQPGGSPAAIADGSVPPALERMLGTAGKWTWTRLDASGRETAAVTLDDLGLVPIDTVLISLDTLDDMARFRLDAERDEALGGTGRELQRQARAVIGVLGGQPALLRDIAALDEPAIDAAETRARDADILAELHVRYAVLRASAQRLIDGLTAAITRQDEPALRRHIFIGLRWGIRPMLNLAEQRTLWSALLDDVAAPDPALLPRVARQASDAMKSRLAAAPAADTREPIARKLAELAAPDGQLAILSQVDGATLARKSRMRTVGVAIELDEQWLPVVAAVRAPLARLEALLLQSLSAQAPLLDAWSNAPGDPWRTQAVTSLRQQRDAQGGQGQRSDVPRLVVAYTEGDVWPTAGAREPLAVSLVDSWTEIVPRAAQTTTAAFGFNAPAARPPQAILLAVPPVLDSAFGAPLSTADLVEIVDETRALAHARAADAERLGPYLAVVPTVMLPASGSTGIRLDTGTTFPS